MTIVCPSSKFQTRLTYAFNTYSMGAKHAWQCTPSYFITTIPQNYNAHSICTPAEKWFAAW